MTTAEDTQVTGSVPSTSVRVVIPGLAALSEDLSQTFNISDAAHTKALKVARDMELYERRASSYRATLILEKQAEQEAKKQMMRETGADNNNDEEQEEIVLDETLDPLDFWNKVSYFF